jgi:cold shock CspA family protein
METKQGTISSWLFSKGFGFVISDGVKYFLHISSLKGSVAPSIGGVVSFKVSPVLEGRCPSAIDAEIVEGGAL